jgi:hypothetical protein
MKVRLKRGTSPEDTSVKTHLKKSASPGKNSKLPWRRLNPGGRATSRHRRCREGELLEHHLLIDRQPVHQPLLRILPANRYYISEKTEQGKLKNDKRGNREKGRCN